MTEATKQIIRLTLEADKTVTQEEKDGINSIMQGVDKESMSPLGGVVTRKDLARLARRSVKWVDRFARDNPSVLKRVKGSGKVRSIGFSRDSVVRFLAGRSLQVTA